ncbi:MAG: DUF4013 domain-containing protein [Candidatus Diapherotrites archaeon]
MANFFEAIKRPFADRKALVLGTAIGALPGVNIFLLGFGLLESERLLSKRRKPLGWWQMEGITSTTICAFAIILAYFLPVAFVSIFFLSPLLARVGQMFYNPGTGLLWLAQIGFNPFVLFNLFIGVCEKLAVLFLENLYSVLPVALVGVFFYYVLPFALVNFVKKESLVEAFNFEVVKGVFSFDYFLLWIFFHLYVYILFSVLAFFFFLPVINFLLFGFVSFVFVSSGANLFTQLFMEKNGLASFEPKKAREQKSFVSETPDLKKSIPAKKPLAKKTKPFKAKKAKKKK